MDDERREPHTPIEFIRRCVAAGRIYWSYHVNMRMRDRSIGRDEILAAAPTFQVIEAYPHDKYLPSYLVRANGGDRVFHVLFATDVTGDNVRVITAYLPDPSEWTGDFTVRREP
jgi:hypothetical protein